MLALMVITGAFDYFRLVRDRDRLIEQTREDTRIVLTRWSIARPIRALIRGARAVGGGDLSQRIAVRRPDEIGQLADEFNRMAENLERAHGSPPSPASPSC